jgi:fructose-1,6-bisphosphatase/inositol monophosphatase family enzyme
MTDVRSRLEFAKQIVRNSSVEALEAFSNWKDLAITAKGAQAFVSEVDKSTELYLRAKIQEAYESRGLTAEGCKLFLK